MALLEQPLPEAAWEVVRGNAANAALQMRRPNDPNVLGQHPEFDAAVWVDGHDGERIPPIRPLLGVGAVARAAWLRDMTRLRSAPAALRFQGLEGFPNPAGVPLEGPGVPQRASPAAMEVALPAWCEPPPPAQQQGPPRAVSSDGTAAAREAQAAQHAPPHAVYVTAGGAVGLADALRLPPGVAALLRGSPALWPAAAGAAPHAPCDSAPDPGLAGERESAPAGTQAVGGQQSDGGPVRCPGLLTAGLLCGLCVVWLPTMPSWHHGWHETACMLWRCL